MKAVLYARVSTKDQDLAAQVDALRDAAIPVNLVIHDAYAEKETATGKVSRKAYDRLLKDARDVRRPWSTILVWSVDRFSREARYERTIAVIHDLEARGIVLRFLKDPECDTPAGTEGHQKPVNTTILPPPPENPSSIVVSELREQGRSDFTREIMLVLKLLIAAQEADRIAERTQLHMDAIKAGTKATRSGRPPGRPVRITEEKRRRILAMRASGAAYREIAHAVGLPKGTCRAVVSKAKGEA